MFLKAPGVQVLHFPVSAYVALIWLPRLRGLWDTEGNYMLQLHSSLVVKAGLVSSCQSHQLSVTLEHTSECGSCEHYASALRPSVTH